jgi:dnd system-associated protein 4
MRNLRVYIDKDKHELYEKLVKRGNEDPENYPFQTMKDVFILAACIGAKNDEFISLQSSKDIFSSDVFDIKIDLPVMSSLAFKRTQDLDTLLDEKKILEITQEYANGGIHLVIDQIINNPGKPLNNLISLILS